MQGRTLLVVDDNEAVRTALDVLFGLEGARVEGVGTPGEALRRLARGGIDLVIQDMNFQREATSGREGIELFHALKAARPDLPVVLLTAWTHLETAVDLVKAGAADYVAKPWDNARLVTTVRNLLQLQAALAAERRREESAERARAELAARFDLRGIVYRSQAMHVVLQMATQVARADVPVLITGPNGAGKEIVAEIIQANSSVRGGPFVRVDIGALPAELLESEIFGSEAGAFTGAKARAGRFEAADGGTLFLDEIGNLSLAGQAKLLRVLQTGEFERLGSTQTRRVNVRIVSATNASLAEAIRQGRFREDLYYRLNVIELQVPPLAERREDVLPLARHFLEPGYELAPEAERALLRHDWPGNVRELRNCIRRACLLAASPRIGPQDLVLPAAASGTDAAAAMAEPDRRDIEAALERNEGIVSKAARDLGLSRQSLYRRMEKLGIGAGAGENG
ncbi:MAG: sigma-54-dependent Fis family transcriptional regulator [Lysobacterales bacterium]|nr:MAG: sigma-54-dependent Fis family transcriptional regulator [Xanthomonadales bacterium]